MKNQKDKIKQGLSFWIGMYPGVTVVESLLFLFRSLRWIRVIGSKNLPKDQKAVLYVSNHPSLLEAWFLVAFCSAQHIWHPIKGIPWSTPDQKNYVKNWFWGLFISRYISVPRGDHRAERRAISKLNAVLRRGLSAILFPEGGRTGKGKEFLYSASGKRIRVLKPGVGRVVCRVNCTVIPVYIEGTDKIQPIDTWLLRPWHRITIRIGEPLEFKAVNDPKKGDFVEATTKIAEALLKTAG